jgi:hypothetical protein
VHKARGQRRDQGTNTMLARVVLCCSESRSRSVLGLQEDLTAIRNTSVFEVVKRGKYQGDIAKHDGHWDGSRCR